MGQTKSKSQQLKSKQTKKKQEIHDQVYGMLREFKCMEQEYLREREGVFIALNLPAETTQQHMSVQRGIVHETNFFIQQIQDAPSLGLIAAFLRYLDFVYRSFPKFTAIQESLALIANKLHFISLDVNHPQNLEGISQLVKDRFSYISTFLSQISSHKHMSLRSEIDLLKSILIALQNNLLFTDEDEISQYFLQLEDISTNCHSELSFKTNTQFSHRSSD